MNAISAARTASPRKSSLVLAAALILGFKGSSTARAWQTDNIAPVQTSSAAAPASTSPAPPASDHLRLSGVAYCGSTPSGPNETPRPCRLGDTLFVGFTNLREWMAVPTNNVSAVTLVLNGRLIKHIPSRGPNDSYSGLQFDLKRLSGDSPDERENREAWNTIMTELRRDPWLHVSITGSGNPPFWGSAAVPFRVFSSLKWLVTAFLLLLLVLLILLARRSDILRDSPSNSGEPKRSYSLARCQMAWWFFLVAASYNYIWLALGDRDSLTAGCLILIGISAGTGLAASVVDGSKQAQRVTLEKEQAVIQARLDELSQALTATSDPAQLSQLKAEQAQNTTRLAEIHSALAILPEPPGPSEGFLFDVLRDETGVSFHRFQMAAWTIILGFVFLTSVYRDLTMPDFSTTLLGLMGISSGTYIGFKLSDAAK